MTCKLQKARDKREHRAAKKVASNYAKRNADPVQEAERAGFWQRMTERRAVTRELGQERDQKNRGKIAKIFTKIMVPLAAVMPPPKPRTHRSRG